MSDRQEQGGVLMRFVAVSPGLFLAVILLSSSAQGSGVCYKDPAIGFIRHEIVVR